MDSEKISGWIAMFVAFVAFLAMGVDELQQVVIEYLDVIVASLVGIWGALKAFKEKVDGLLAR